MLYSVVTKTFTDSYQMSERCGMTSAKLKTVADVSGNFFAAEAFVDSKVSQNHFPSGAWLREEI